jgi:hypothetical protein
MSKVYTVDDESDTKNKWLTATNVVALASMVVWGGLLLAIGVGGILFVRALDRATTVFQECAVSGIFAVGFIGFYIAARCVESVLAHGAKVKREE